MANFAVGPPGVPEVETEPGVPLADEIVSDEPVPEVDQATVRALLRGIGGATHYLLRDEDVKDHWRFTPDELAALVPPLTRVINRRTELRRAVLRGDEATVALELAQYTGRNVADGRKAKKERDANNQGQVGQDPAGHARGGGADGVADGSSTSDGYRFPAPAGGALRQ